MSHLRFNHVFVGLLVLSLLSAFVISPRYTSPIKAQVQGIFFPIARPAHLVGGWVAGVVSRPVDERAPQDVSDENLRLRNEVIRLTTHVEHLNRLLSEERELGSLADLTVTVPVIGSDPGRRDSIALQGTFSQEWVDRPVLYVGGVVGRISRAGVGGAQVRLITDVGFSVAAKFARFQHVPEAGVDTIVPLDAKLALLEGAGDGKMIVRNLEKTDVEGAGIRIGDMLLIDDPDWAALGGRMLGEVIAIDPRPNAPLSMDIRVRPHRSLTALREVRVLTGG